MRRTLILTYSEETIGSVDLIHDSHTGHVVAGWMVLFHSLLHTIAHVLRYGWDDL